MAIITPSQARDAGRELGKKLMEADAQNSAEFKAMMEEINKTPLGIEDTAEIGALLALPDNQFSIIAPAFIEELQKSYNDVNQYPVFPWLILYVDKERDLRYTIAAQDEDSRMKLKLKNT